MEKLLLLLGLATLLGTSVYLMTNETSQKKEKIAPEVVDLFVTWKKANNKKYGSPDQDLYRLSVFNDNYNYIQAFYEGPEQTYSLGFTQFMDVTQEEFESTYLGFLPQEELEKPEELSNDVAQEVDWRKKGVLNSIRYQGACLSCWAFSAIGAAEPAFVIFKKLHFSLSEQQLVDCSRSYGSYGCQGGYMASGFNYMKDHGIMSNQQYPYKGVEEKCHALDTKNTKISGYKVVTTCSSLKKAVNSQPISVAVDASNWRFYKGGVFTSCSSSPNFAVVVVGYDAYGHWIIRNSWGTAWGEYGYMKLGSGNTCGVCNTGSYPVV